MEKMKKVTITLFSVLALIVFAGCAKDKNSEYQIQLNNENDIQDENIQQPDPSLEKETRYEGVLYLSDYKDEYVRMDKENVILIKVGETPGTPVKMNQPIHLNHNECIIVGGFFYLSMAMIIQDGGVIEGPCWWLYGKDYQGNYNYFNNFTYFGEDNTYLLFTADKIFVVYKDGYKENLMEGEDLVNHSFQSENRLEQVTPPDIIDETTFGNTTNQLM